MMTTIAWTAAAAGAFGITNIDNTVVLTAQLSASRIEGEKPLRLGHAVRGQYLALLVLLVVSAVGASGLLLLPARGAALVGLVPLGMGLHRMGVARGVARLLPIGVRHGSGTPALVRNPPSGTWAVALLSISCGADNVVVYSPVLAKAGFPGALVVVEVFAALVPVMCVLAMWLARRAAVLAGVRALNAKVFPMCLITVGLLALKGALV